jgi:hypothetical protein
VWEWEHKKVRLLRAFAIYNFSKVAGWGKKQLPFEWSEEYA